MADATDMFIQNILKCKELKDNLSKFVQRYAKGIDRIADLIPDFLQADRQMLADLKAETDNILVSSPRKVPKITNFNKLYFCKVYQLERAIN
jgi:hypothetical protein